MSSRFTFVFGCLLLLLLVNLFSTLGYENHASVEGFADEVIHGGCESGDC